MLNWFNRLINQRQNTNLDTNVNLYPNLDHNIDHNLNADLDNFINDVSLTIFYTPLVLLNNDSSQLDNLVFVLINNNNNVKHEYKTNILIVCFKISDVFNDKKFVRDFFKLSS